MCDGPTIFEAKERTARKVYKCYECRLPIKKGEKYISHSGLWPTEGGWCTMRLCLFCDMATPFVRDVLYEAHGPWECMIYGQLWETAQELDFACKLSDKWWYEEQLEEAG